MEHTHFIDKEPNKYEALTELQKQHIQSMKEEQVLDVIDRFEEAWSLKSNDFRNARELGYRQFVHPDNFDEYGNPSVNDIDLLAIKGIRDKQMTYLTNLKNHVRDLKIHKQEPNDDGITVLKRVNNIKRQIDDGYHNIRRHYMSFERVDNPTVQPQFSVLGDPTTLDAEEVENSTPFQKCLLYSLDQTYKAGYRRYKGQCCEEIRTVEGHRTRAWRPKFTIEQFVYSLAQKDDNFEVWKNFTSRGTVFRDVIDNMSKCLDAQFPEITKRRHVWSFKNGVFVGKEWIPDRGVYDCCFYSYESQEFRCLDPTIIACKYFDQQFDDFSHLENWQDIPTPWFDSVLKYQKFEMTCGITITRTASTRIQTCGV